MKEENAKTRQEGIQDWHLDDGSTKRRRQTGTREAEGNRKKTSDAKASLDQSKESGEMTGDLGEDPKKLLFTTQNCFTGTAWTLGESLRGARARLMKEISKFQQGKTQISIINTASSVGPYRGSPCEDVKGVKNRTRFAPKGQNAS